MIANMALLVGLTLGLAPEMERHVHGLTFGQARRNFYEAARLGLDAELLWPRPVAPSPRRTSVADAVFELLPVARQGLVSGGAEPAEADAWLAIIHERVSRRQTGALWQAALWSVLRHRLSPEAASAALLERYIELSDRGDPVHEWPDPMMAPS